MTHTKDKTTENQLQPNQIAVHRHKTGANKASIKKQVKNG